jgi:ATP-dependent DNA helicase RecQ
MRFRASDVPNGELYDSLKRWRDLIVEESGLPIYMVVNQNALKEIATYLPFSKKDLVKLSGFGKAKAEKYGDNIVDMVMEYCERNNLESNMDSKEGNPKRERKEKSLEEKTPTNILSFNLYKEGKTIPEIAKERNLSTNTIEGHLATFIASKQINIDDFVSNQKQKLIKEAIKIHGTSGTRNLKDNLPEDISYGEIRMVMAAETEE